jgi:Tol biopolymer transport system component
MSLTPGTRLGPYEILAPLGAGGMGEVYRARDTRLDRQVAIKILPEAFGRDGDRVARFEREARSLAALNHPNIAHIHDLEDSQGVRALVMELVDGEDLTVRLARGPLPPAEALAIATQIADALDAAHERGIIHRDLKPANIKVTDTGTVKILDFGLAKAMDGADAVDPMNSPTFASPATQLGVILGTTAYMAPEQAKGKTVDKRADIWAFGCVLYEMLTGQSPFAAASAAESLAHIVAREPDWTALPASLPRGVRQLVQRCLQKDPRLRLRDIADARFALTQPQDETDVERSAGTSRAVVHGDLRRAVAWTAIATVLVLLGILAGARRFSGAAIRPQTAVLRLGIDAGGDTPLAGVGWAGLNWIGPTAVLSPDGTLLVFIARGPSGGRWQLYTRRLDELRARPLVGTEEAYAPFFSPDGNSIAFFAGGSLKKVALNGGGVSAICPAKEGRGGTWGQDGTIVFAPRPDGPLFRVSSAGGTPQPATTVDAASGETTHRWPQMLPGGKGFLFTAHGDMTASRGGTIVVQTATGERKVVHRAGLYARYAPSGHLLYVEEGRLFAAAFDVNGLEVTGQPVVVADEVAHALLNGSAQFSFSDTGLFAYRRARSTNRSLLWMNPAGQVQTMRTVPAEYMEARFSSDGARLLLVVGDGVQSDVWTYDIAADKVSRLTFHPDNDWSPIWSPDSSHIVYASWRGDTGTFNLFLHRADGTAEPLRLTSSRNSQSPLTWHPDGSMVLFVEQRPDTGADLMLLPIEKGANGEIRPGPTRPLLTVPANQLTGEFSPDGKWLAYTSDESGRSEVFVQPFPGPGGRWQVSTEGAEWIEWRRNGQLYLGRSEESVMTLGYRTEGSTFVAEKPRLWMRIPPGVWWVDPAPDGTRAAIIRSDETRRESLVLLVNFFDHLRRTVASR